MLPKCSFLISAARRDRSFASVHEAVKNGDVGELEAMVKNGASVNEIDNTKDRFTPLHWACHRGALEVNIAHDVLELISVLQSG